MQKELIDELKEVMIPEGDNILEIITGFMTKDPAIFLKEIKKMMEKPICISDILFWNNFRNFIIEGKFNYNMIRRISEKLANEGDSRESAVKIVESIRKIDEPIKAKYIANLTNSLVNGLIDKVKYFRLVNVIGSLPGVDLLYVSEHIEYSGVVNDESPIEEFLAVGIMRIVKGGYAYTEKAYDLVEYGIRLGDDVSRPKEILPRLVMTEVTDQDIDDIINGTFIKE